MRTSGDPPNYSIIKIGQNCEKSPRDLRSLAVIQTPVRNHLSKEFFVLIMQIIIIHD